jgi:hypothetical protein
LEKFEYENTKHKMKWELLTSSEITLPKKHKDDQKMRDAFVPMRQTPKASGSHEVLGDERTDGRVVRG